MSCSADWASPRFGFSRTSLQRGEHGRRPCANGEAPVFGRRRNSWPTSHSPGPVSSIATSSMVASPEPSREDDLAAEHLGDDAHLAAALLEAAQVDEAGRDDLAGADARDAADREEDAALAGDLDDQADHARRIVLAVDHEHVAHLADPVAGGVENGAPGESGDEHSRGTHA